MMIERIAREDIVALMLDTLSPMQKRFILRMEPHADDQPISRTDWDDIEPYIPSAIEWPDVYWFGGMRLSFGGGDAGDTITFRFNDDGLAIQAALQGEGR